MQKKLIALAVVAAFSAPAFADVTVYGTVDGAIARISQDGGSVAATRNRKTDTLAVSGGLSTSRLGVKTVEDIGDMKAVVVLEYGLDTEQAGGIGLARQQLLGLAGGFGTVATGYLQTTAYDYGVKFDPTAGSLVSPLQNMTAGNAGFLIGTKATATRAPRALAYISPNLGGVVIAVNHSTAFSPATGNLTLADTAPNGKTSATLLSANYEGGPIAASVVYAGTSGTSAAIPNNLTSYALGGSFDLTVVKLFATYQTAKNSAIGSLTNKLYNISAVIPVGPGAVAVSYAKATIGTAAGVNGNGSGYTVAYLQGLSKATTAYAALSSVSNGANTGAFSVASGLVAGGPVGNTSTLLAVGLKKTF